MNVSGQIMPFFFASAFIGLGYLFCFKKKYIHGTVTTVLAFIIIVLAQLNSTGVPLFNLTLEQILCWMFGLLFFTLAVIFATKDKLSYAFIILLISALTCFCGLTSVQSLLKTHMLWMVTSSLDNYAKKIDQYQETLLTIQTNLGSQQLAITTNQLEVRLNQEKLDAVGFRIANAESNVFAQQEDLARLQTKLLNQQGDVESISSNLTRQQYQIQKAGTDITGQQKEAKNTMLQIETMQGTLASAESHLSSQQKQIESVESMIRDLYERKRVETFHSTDNKRVVVQHFGTKTRYFFILPEIPVRYSVQGYLQARKGLMPGLVGAFLGEPAGMRMPMGPLTNFKNIAVCDIDVPGWDFIEFPQHSTFTIEYTKDIEQTNATQKIEIRGKDAYFDNVKTIINSF